MKCFSHILGFSVGNIPLSQLISLHDRLLSMHHKARYGVLGGYDKEGATAPSPDAF
jgi:hypothetical protein